MLITDFRGIRIRGAMRTIAYGTDRVRGQVLGHVNVLISYSVLEATKTVMSRRRLKASIFQCSNNIKPAAGGPTAPSRCCDCGRLKEVVPHRRCIRRSFFAHLYRQSSVVSTAEHCQMFRTGGVESGHIDFDFGQVDHACSSNWYSRLRIVSFHRSGP